MVDRNNNGYERATSDTTETEASPSKKSCKTPEFKLNFLETPFQARAETRREDSSVIIDFKIWCDEKPEPESEKLVRLGQISVVGNGKSELSLEAKRSSTSLVDFSSDIVSKLKEQNILEDNDEAEINLLACQTLVAKEVKTERKQYTAERIEREIFLLNNLSKQEFLLIEETLEIISTTKSTWLINLFKYAASAREAQLNDHYGTNSFNFESQGTFWYEAGWDVILKKKLRNAITLRLPEFFRIWLDKFRLKRESLKIT